MVVNTCSRALNSSLEGVNRKTTCKNHVVVSEVLRKKQDAFSIKHTVNSAQDDPEPPFLLPIQALTSTSRWTQLFVLIGEGGNDASLFSKKSGDHPVMMDWAVFQANKQNRLHYMQW